MNTILRCTVKEPNPTSLAPMLYVQTCNAKIKKISRVLSLMVLFSNLVLTLNKPVLFVYTYR